MGVQGSRPEKLESPVPVTLHIYDVGTDFEIQAMNFVLRRLGSGAFHCGVEVYGQEWSYRGTVGPGTGIFWCWPRACSGHHYHDSLAMGWSHMPKAEVHKALTSMALLWRGEDYDLLKHNCCHYVASFCKTLGVGPLPDWLTHLADTGAAIVDTGQHLEMRRRGIAARITQQMQGVRSGYGICHPGCCLTCDSPHTGRKRRPPTDANDLEVIHSQRRQPEYKSVLVSAWPVFQESEKRHEI